MFVGLFVIVLSIAADYNDYYDVIIVSLGVLMFIIGAGFYIGLRVEQVKVLNFFQLVLAPAAIGSRRAQPVDIEDRRAVASNYSVPGAGAPDYSIDRVLKEIPDTKTLPTSCPLVPMYRLDKSFKIVDWNDAFSLAFDRSMDGLRGKSAAEWVFYLENYKEAIEHGEKLFANKEKFPSIDVETLVFNSYKYGKINAIKRSYLIPDDSGELSNWLVILDPKFEAQEIAMRYHYDLVNALGRESMWSEYSISYDNVLTNTLVYPELLDQMIGVSDGMDEIPANSKVLDLGAGTGNISLKLVQDPNIPRTVYAIEKNDAMYDSLRYKCADYIRNDADGPGVITVNRNIESLVGLHSDYFDCAILNNVLYAVDSPKDCLREVWRVLRVGGEVRISGPKRNSNLNRLFRRIRVDLKVQGKEKELASDVIRAEWINHHLLAPMFKHWDLDILRQLVLDSGFSTIVYETERAYAGQAMIIAARK